MHLTTRNPSWTRNWVAGWKCKLGSLQDGWDAIGKWKGSWHWDQYTVKVKSWERTGHSKRLRLVNTSGLCIGSWNFSVSLFLWWDGELYLSAWLGHGIQICSQIVFWIFSVKVFSWLRLIFNPIIFKKSWFSSVTWVNIIQLVKHLIEETLSFLEQERILSVMFLN